MQSGRVESPSVFSAGARTVPAQTVSLHQGGPLSFGPQQILDQLNQLTAGSA